MKNVESILLNILRVEELSITVPVNPETPISDQDRISPYSINILSSRQVMGKEKKSIRGLLVDPKPNSPN